MVKKNLKTLVIGDEELECKTRREVSIDDLSISHIGFVSSDLESYDLVVYKGSKGDKILRSSLFPRGVIK